VDLINDYDTPTPADDDGTRAPGDVLDANGPYGTPADPEYEGTTLPLETHVYDVTGADVSAGYQFRWSPRNDGTFTSWSAPGQTITPYKYTDDYQGQALAQAWDGSTQSIWENRGSVQNEQDWPFYVFTYFYEETMTTAWEFDVTEDCRVEKFGLYRYSTTITWGWEDCDALRIYDKNTQAVMGEILNPLPEPSDDDWQWYTVSTPFNLYAGETYLCASVFSCTDAYLAPEAFFSPGATADGVIVPDSTNVLWSYIGDGFPSTQWATFRPFVLGTDFEYSVLMDEQPIVLEDTADVFVWNLAPSVFGASVTPSEHVEGAGGEEFTAWLTDPGVDDDWEFMWDWGDGTQSEWMPVPRHGGGARVVFLEGLAGMAAATITAIEAELGPDAIVFDVIDIESSIPDLDDLLPYDVALLACWGYPSDVDELGDVLADFCDAGGGVVQCGGSFWPSPPGQMGAMGRWEDEEYNAIEYTIPTVTTRTLGTYNAAHPIMAGVSSITSMVNHPSYATTMYSDWIASFADTALFVAKTEAGHHGMSGTGRIVGINSYINQPTYITGDALRLIRNAIMWASGQPDAYLLYPPLQLPAVDHIYVDDHPTTFTPSDTFYPKVYVRDDDHCNDVMIGNVLEYFQNFNSGWGMYGNNPPSGWTIIDNGFMPQVWDYNDWHRYTYSGYRPTGGSGAYARVWYYPIEDQDEELISPDVDISGVNPVTLEWDNYFWHLSDDYGYVDVSFDGGSSWSNVWTVTWTTNAHRTYSINTGGASTMQVRFRYVANDDWMWSIDDVEFKDGSTVLWDEDFGGSWGTFGNNPPSGWTIIDNGVSADPWNTNDWHRYTWYTSYPGGDGTQAARCYYYPYENGDEWFISPVFDFTDPSFTEASIEFDTYWFNYYGYNDGYVYMSVDGGSWQLLTHYDSTTDEHVFYNMNAQLGHTVQIAFNYLSPQYNYLGYGYWYIDNFRALGIPELRHCWGMSRPAEVTKTIHNVFPSLIIPDDFVSEADEAYPFEFVGLEITDPALQEKTESFWYRWDMDDGTPIGSWINIPSAVGTIYEDFEQGTGWPWAPWTRYAGTPPQFEAVHTAAAHDGTYGLEVNQGGYMWYYRTDLSLGAPGTSLAFWLNVPGYGPSMTQSGRAYMGFGADAIGAYEFIIAPNTNQIMIYDDYPYGSFQQLAATPYTFTRDGWYKCVMDFVSWTEVDCVLYDEDGRTELARVGTTRAAGWNTPGGISFRAFDYGLTPRHFYIDTYDDGAPPLDPVIPAFTHIFMDNGIYYVDFQAIDDDMYWDLTSGYPVYRGPFGQEDAWISHNIVPIAVNNRDPTAGPIRAEINLDLAIRQTGEPGNEVTMTLFYDGGYVDSVTISHDGNQQIGVIPTTLDVGNINNYHIEVSYTGTPDGGANPTWVFQGRFSSGHIKELKHEYKYGDPDWIIGPEYLRAMLVGEDITFLVDAADPGSDDLAFLWNFGDDTPHGINVYANVAPMVAVEGTSVAAPMIFDALGANRDPWFEKSTNNIRSPFGGPIRVSEAETHAFDESYHYYVSLICMDDDVCDGYPSYQNFMNGGGYDMEFIEVDLS
jgi:hypothetical protein